ncbi:HNH endonuclease [Actinoplanes sp. NPDC051859]|uniref:HNH endonuclease n=1 Tax=Actinoplanes sp. NPDC051859 TaxID=3363909 RepID=UPI0037A376B9
MAQGRPAIPADLERALMVEAGHRCAIPTCRAVEPLQIEHIVDWAENKEHEFENMIVLCSSCHDRKVKAANPRKLDRKALQQYKANLRLVNNKYGGIEQHILEYFALNPSDASIQLAYGQKFMITYLLRDGLLEPVEATGDLVVGDPSNPELRVLQSYGLSESGREFVEKWINARPLPGGDAVEDGK